MAKQLVLGIFENLETAEAAVEKLRTGASDYSEMHLGPIGILVVDDNGQLKEDWLFYNGAAFAAQLTAK